MPEGLALADGTAADAEELSREFARAMAAPEPDEPSVKSPPRVTGEAKEEKPAAAARKPRVRAEKSPVTPKGEKPKSYQAKLSELTEAGWFALSQLPPTRAQAEILWANRPQLVNGWAVAAESNAMIARGIDAISGTGTWIAVVAMGTLPFAMQSYALWARPSAMEQAGLPSKADLEKATEARLMAMAEQQNEALRQQADQAA